MQDQRPSSSRKKFLWWGAALLATVTTWRFMPGRKNKPQTVKMLTQDGKLVEVDKQLLVNSKKKISNEELQGWIKK